MYEVGGRQFKSKSALQQFVRSILNEQLGDVDIKHWPFLLELFSRHRDAPSKLRGGIRAIRVVLAMPYKTRCFEIHRHDGTSTDISYLECLKPSTAYDWFPAACRTAVVPQIRAFKDAAFLASNWIPCAVSGVPVSRDDCHVDHAPPWPFESIVWSFVNDSFIDISKVAFVDGDNEVQSRFADDAIAASFAAFHADRAQLRVVSRWTNLSTLRRGW